MTFGLACAFLLVLVALLLRFGIPRATAQTLANAKWFALGFAVMFALLALIAAGRAGALGRVSTAPVVRQLSELGARPAGTVVLLEARVSDTMAANDKGWVAWDQGDGPRTSRTALRVTFPDGELETLGGDYDGAYWNVQRSTDTPSYYYLSRGDEITVQGSTGPKGVSVTRVDRGHRAANVAHEARMDYLSSLASAGVAAASALGVPLLLVFALGRRRRELGARA